MPSHTLLMRRSTTYSLGSPTAHNCRSAHPANRTEKSHRTRPAYRDATCRDIERSRNKAEVSAFGQMGPLPGERSCRRAEVSATHSHG